jgi:TRAP-type C4-dicarboxylate transport system permease small subunit
VIASFQKLINVLTLVSKHIATTANVIGTLVVLFLVVMVNYDIVARGVFNHPFRGAYEVVQFTMVLIVFLQLPDVMRVNRLTRSDGLLLLIGEKSPRIAALMRRAINFLSATVMTLIAVATFPEFIDMWDTQDFFGVPGVFKAPWWPIKLTILCSAVLCALILILKVLSRTGSDKPT